MIICHCYSWSCTYNELERCNLLERLIAMLRAIDTVVISFHVLGFVTLSAVLLTVILAENVHRHPVFVNFMWTYLLYTALTIFM